MGLKSLIIVLLGLSFIYGKSKSEIEIAEDFTAIIEHSTTGSGIWIQRGEAVFTSKSSSKNNKQSYLVRNNESKSFYEILKSECNSSGFYLVRIKLNDFTYFSSAPAVRSIIISINFKCLVLEKQLIDKFIFSFNTIASKNTLEGFTYELGGTTAEKKNEDSFISTLSFTKLHKPTTPILQETKKEKAPGSPEAQEEPSFFKKYVS